MAPTEEHLFDWGNNLLHLRAFDQAVEVFTAAIARHPQSARLHVGLGIAQYSRGQYEEAVKSFCTPPIWRPPIRAPTSFSARCTAFAPELGDEITSAWPASSARAAHALASSTTR